MLAGPANPSTIPNTPQLYPGTYVWYPQSRMQMPVPLGIITSVLFQLLRFPLHPAAALELGLRTTAPDSNIAPQVFYMAQEIEAHSLKASTPHAR